MCASSGPARYNLYDAFILIGMVAFCYGILEAQPIIGGPGLVLLVVGFVGRFRKN
jgi:hypothetical protein